MKLYIIGQAGCGKTTLAKKISREKRIPHFDLDDLEWEDLGPNVCSHRRTDEEKTALLKNILEKNPDWICEGMYYKDWIFPCIKEADEVLILKLNKFIWINRFVLRCIKRLLHIEKMNNKQTPVYMYQCFKRNYNYNKNYLPEIIKKLRKERIKYTILTRW